MDRLRVMDDLRQVALVERLAAHRADVEVLRFICGFAVVPCTCDFLARHAVAAPGVLSPL